MISSLDLARLCGVSQGTVDRALHGRRGVAEGTRARILAAAAEHGHRPNPAAREMMGLATSSLVGAVTNEGWPQASFFVDLMAAIHRRLRRDGLRLVIAFAGDADDHVAALSDLASRRVRGLLLIHPPFGLQIPEHLGAPVIALVQALPGLPSPLPDEQAMGAKAAQHLLDLGHRRLVWLNYPRLGDDPVARDRQKGFCATARQADATVTCVSDVAAALTAKATAIGCHNDPLARELRAYCAIQRVRIPADISVIGIDGTGPDDGLSTVVYPVDAVADATAVVLAGGALPAIAAGVVRVGTSCGRAGKR